MFCDLVGSTALAARLDPEDMRSVINAYHRAVAEAVTRFGGYVAKYMGDGVLVLFGYPQAHEDDPEQGVRAGLAVVRAVETVRTPEPVHVRVGIATGLTVVGDLIGSGSAEERSVVGDVPNLAARLQSLAQPDTVVVAEGTRRLIGALFDLFDLGPLRLRGIGGESQAWQVLRETRGAGRFEALRAGATPFMGRQEELDTLTRRWAQAAAGSGRVVLLSGEAGIGKSRLVAALIGSMSDEQHVVLRFDCVPHAINSALHPVIVNLERSARLDDANSSFDKASRLEEFLAPARCTSDEFRAIADLLGVPAVEAAAPLAATPQKRKELALAALIRQVEGLAAARPVLLVWEDLHWIDPTSLEFLGLLIDRAPSLRILVLGTARPEFSASWIGRPQTSMVHLSRLDGSEVAALVHLVAGQRLLSRDLVDEIVRRTDGVPLFVEELTKTIVEEGAARGSTTRVPASLQAALTARLDRLGSARETAQLGSVIGREFSYRALTAISERGPNALADHLGQLEAAELIRGRGELPDRTYTFKHALVQDAAYEGLLRARRQALHERLADVLATDKDLRERQPELLAYHYERGGRQEDAARHYLAAGRLALRRSASAEAVTHLERGLANNPPRGVAADLFGELAQALALLQGYAAPAVGAAIEQAIERVDAADVERTAKFLLKYCNFSLVAGRLRLALELAQRIIDLELPEHLSNWQASAKYHKGLTLLGLGTADEAYTPLQESVREIDPFNSSTSVAAAHNPGVGARVYTARALLARGFPAKALSVGRDAIELARQLNDPFSLVFATSALAHTMKRMRFNEDEAGRLRNEAAALATSQGYTFYLSHYKISDGLRRTREGDFSAVDFIHEGIAELTRAGAFYQYAMTNMSLAEAYDFQGRTNVALKTLENAIEKTNEMDDRELLSELHRLRAGLFEKLGEQAKVEQELQAALSSARSQGARMWELRAARDLASVWAKQGLRQEARVLLAPVYGWFTEGLHMPDLAEARELLLDLGQA